MDPVATHSCHLLQQLQEQRIQGLLCDCMLVVRGVCFKAHKNVLAAFSQYFRCLFQNSSGQKNDVFHLDIKNVSGIGQILDFMYTSRLDLTQDNVQVMADVAQCLQVHNVLHLCHTFLQSAVADEPAALPCGSAFSLQKAPAPDDANCVVTESYTAHLSHECPPDAEPRIALDEPPPHQPASGNLQNSTDEIPEAPESLDSSCPELPLKQPNYYYKLRNLYSKQYYKQAPCPSHEKITEQPFPFSTPTDPNAARSPPCAVSHPECVLESSEHLPSNFLAQPLSNSAPDPEPDSACPQPPKPMRLKKAVHLKKLNFLKSQKSAEQASAPKSDKDVAERLGSANENTTEQASSQSPQEKESEELVSLENFGCVSEAERPEDPATLEDPSQTLQSQRQYTCELCGKPFKHPSNLELHKRSHTGEKPFECNICGKRFSQAGNLQTHLRRHSGEKPYICEICGKRFAASGDVQRHIIIHSVEKPHLCDTCGRGFSNFSNLKEHKKTHTADKVFTCDECGKSFNMQRKLVKHRIWHTGERPYSCSACGKCFGGSGDLRRHVRTHTGEKPYTCEICNKCFTRSAVLRRHRKMHGKADADRPGTPETPDLDPPQRSHSPTPDATVNGVPVGDTLPAHSTEEPETELDSRCAGACCKLRAHALPSQGVRDHEKLSGDPGKLAKHPMQPAYTYADVEAEAEPLPADSMSIIRSSLAALDSHCSDALGARAPSTAYRSSEGQFFSSMTLWGLAMKTLQNESELDQ
ncbi:PREDICTED: zinc finger and BTB domain-containing protein 49 [Chrysochloris asiatica]|uniref:Zinc finger and BTB domain-containing protein 49 n=1 Tax=Chrysochloris asiatica TaxID=185453 RepID=A0A9B0U7G2_CHRAS|nr:PREDICTED: zinc finger and BTB domain-containing protein 49 [Chrysochloris asiatica]